ncbi:MAG: xanthine dehydrogenase family protein molybdopterin-binding subunit [Solirubrobacteraceae bacterium]
MRGRARFLDDIELPHMAHIAFVRSEIAHGRIAAIRPPGGARGLLATITAHELAGRVSGLRHRPLDGAQIADTPHPPLADGEVRYVGQPIAAVVATTRAQAEDAAALVEVDYEEQTAVVDPRAAPETLVRWSRRAGNVESTFAGADRVVRARHLIPRLAAAPIETRGAIADNDAGRDLLTVWCSAQDPHRPLAQLAQALGRSRDSVRVIVPDVGGAFGSKGIMGVEVAVAAVAAIDLERPVKWVEDRTENLTGAYQGRGIDADIELALTRDGHILAVRARIFADLGAYLLPNSAVPPHTMAMLMCGCYDIKVADVELTGTRTNKVPTGPCRGAGRPEAAYVLERTVDLAARDLGLDPVELRRRNLIRSWPHRTPLGWTYDSGDYERCLDTALELARPEHGSDERRVVGTGLALYVERAGGQWESAAVTAQADGRIVVRSGSSPHGQGHETTFAQIAADRLGITPDDVVLRFGDSAIVPAGVGTFASRSVAMGGSALVRALDELVAEGRRFAALVLDSPQDSITWCDGAYHAGERSASFAQVAAAAHDVGQLPPDEPPGLEASARFRSDLVFGSGAYAAVVEIERATGVLTVRRLAAVDDAGAIVNPLLAEGQILGGAVHGLGAVTTEEVIYDEGGQPLTGSFLSYGLPTAEGIPPIHSAFVQTPTPLNPLGAKGIGEGGAIGTPAAIANAVADALGGRQIDCPFTPEKLWRALRVTEAQDE